MLSDPIGWTDLIFSCPVITLHTAALHPLNRRHAGHRRRGHCPGPSRVTSTHVAGPPGMPMPSKSSPYRRHAHAPGHATRHADSPACGSRVTWTGGHHVFIVSIFLCQGEDRMCLTDLAPAVISTHLPQDKMAAISQTTISDAFLWMKSFAFWLKFHWSLLLRVKSTIIQHWLR